MNEHCLPNEDSKLNHHENEQSHDKHAGHSVAMFKNKFWVSLVLTMPVLIYSKMIQDWLNFTPPQFVGSEWIPLFFSTVIFAYGGLVFIKSAKAELKNKQPGMMTLISTAIIASYFYSVYLQIVGKHESFFWELATLITIMLLGHWLEMASVLKAQSSLDELAQLLPDKATKLENNQQVSLLVQSLKVGDKVLVRPGGRVPVDGIVLEGQSFVDESAVTGESQLVTKKPNNNVVAGTLNQDGTLTVEVRQIGANTMLSGIMKLVKDAQDFKSKTQLLADKSAFWLTYFAFGVALVALIYWSFSVNFAFGLERAVTVLIIACPHALGLAIPLVVSISTAISAKQGILIRRRLAYENARAVNCVVFDKTGTLTNGKPEVLDIIAEKGYSQKDILQLSASLEQNSEHHLARAILAKATKNKVEFKKVSSFKALPGIGVQAKIGAVKFLLVNKRYLITEDIGLSDNLQKEEVQLLKDAKTVVYLVKKNVVIGLLSLTDSLRTEAHSTIKRLHSLGINAVIVSGDNKIVSENIANKIGISKVYAEVLPKEKASIVKQFQKDGSIVAFVGDGINDAPALAQADVGIAIGAGTDIAIKSADIILINNNLSNIENLIVISKVTYTKMIQNLIWATGYNILAIPLASGLLIRVTDLTLSPALGAVVMSLSTIVVAFNAQLLRRVKI